MKILVVVGTRPNFMKAAPILNAIRRHNHEVLGRSPDAGTQSCAGAIHPVLVHTGQHYSELMSDAFFEDLQLPKPDIFLDAGSGSHAAQTAEIMKRFEKVLLDERPDVVVVVGDVNSTMACALVAAKISCDAGRNRPLIAHVEAGLRSFDRSMPEEVNRIVTDHVSDLFFVTEPSGVLNLRREGIPEEKIHFVGNTMIDSLVAFQQQAEASDILDSLGLRKGPSGQGSSPSILTYALLTLHRPANVDHLDAFSNILDGLQELARDCMIVFPAHPRTHKRIQELGLSHYFEPKQVHDVDTSAAGRAAKRGIRLIEPLRYLDFLCMMMHARLVITDSGGVQEETTFLGIPCVTVRQNTERPVTLTNGSNLLADVTTESIRKAVREQLRPKARKPPPDLWDGKAASRILDAIRLEFEKRKSPLA